MNTLQNYSCKEWAAEASGVDYWYIWLHIDRLNTWRLGEIILYWLLIIWSTCTKFDEIPSRCSWAIMFTRIARTDGHISPHITNQSKIEVLLFLIWTSSSEGFRSFFLLPGRNFFMGRGLLLESWRSAAHKVSTSLYQHNHAYTHTATHTCKAKAPNQTECKAYKDAHPSRTNNIEEQKIPSTNKAASMWWWLWPNQLGVCLCQRA